MWSISHTDKPLYDLDMPAVEDSDPLLGEIAYLLQIVSQIGMLQSWKKAMDVDVDESNVTEETRFASIMATSSLLEAQLENWENPITSSDLEWHQTAEAYRHAAFVFLYRVTYNIGASHPLTVQHVRRCLDALAEVPSESSLASVHIWPLFTAGCESVEYSDREFCRRRLLKMYSERRLPSLPRVLAAMESVWAQKDEETQRGISLDCIAVLKQQGKEVDLAY